MVLLVEGSEKGTLSWKFEAEDKYRIDKIELKFQTDTFHSSANILCKLCAGDSCVRIPNGNLILNLKKAEQKFHSHLKSFIDYQ